MKQQVAMSQSVNWMFNMFQVEMSRGPDMTPIPIKNTELRFTFSNAYFIMTMSFCSFFIVNMFVGVVVSSYNRESERLGKKFMLTDT